jgi:hypothetical protein
MLHGFTPPENLRPERYDKSRYPDDITDISSVIADLPALYGDAWFKQDPAKDFITDPIQNSRAVAVSGRHLGVTMDPTRQLVNSDLSQDLDLTRFVVTVQWENLTTSPYGNATVVMRMPSALVNYLFHGELGDFIPVEKIYGTPNKDQVKVDGFRHIKAGGWMSIRMPYIHRGEKDDDITLNSAIGSVNMDVDGTQNRAVFFGQILSLNVKFVRTQKGSFESLVTMTCGSYIYPLTVSETRRTYKKIDGIADIESGALYEWQDAKHPVIESLKGGEKVRSDEIYGVLEFMLNNFGYMSLPTSLAPARKIADKMVEQRLGDNIGIIGDLVETSFGTIYEANAADINTVRGIPSHYYYSQVFSAKAQSVWGMIQTLFQPNQDLIELFPVLVPLGADGNPLSTASGFGATSTSKERADGGRTINTEEIILGKDLIRSLKAIPYLVYRLKPLPPGFRLSASEVNGLNMRFQGTRDRIEGETYHEEFNGIGVKDDKMSYVHINEQTVLSMDLTWTETNRVNATFFGIPNSNSGIADNLLFGINSVPVFNAEDINRYGLRMKTSDTPFSSEYVSKLSEAEKAAKEAGKRLSRAEKARLRALDDRIKGEIKKFNTIAASASAERLYYLVGEGHYYASGTITLSYTPNPELLAGIWCETFFMRRNSANDPNTGFVAGSGSPNQQVGVLGGGVKPLRYYVTGIAHQVQIDQNTGRPSGTTTLQIERASYGGRLPVVNLKAVGPQEPPPRPKSATKPTLKPKPKRTKTRKRKRK